MSEKVKVEVLQNGPLKVEGTMIIKTEDGKEEVKEKCFFCRCGKSKNQPYCDGSHAKK